MLIAFKLTICLFDTSGDHLWSQKCLLNRVTKIRPKFKDSLEEYPNQQTPTVRMTVLTQLKCHHTL